LSLLIPSSFCGPIAYYKEIFNQTTVRFECHEYFPKQSFRSRCTILGPNGPLRISVPVMKERGSKTPSFLIKVDWSSQWDNLFIRSLKTAYASSPYFEHYLPDIENILNTRPDTLLELNRFFFDFFCYTWGFKLSIEESTSFENYQNNILQKEYRIIDFEQLTTDVVYTQVFEAKNGFSPNVSILDLLFCEGPMGRIKLVNA
jgi:hypothetical protein